MRSPISIRPVRTRAARRRFASHAVVARELSPVLWSLLPILALVLCFGLGGCGGGDDGSVTADRADAAIVGSALVRRVAEQREAGPDAVVAEAEAFASNLAAGLSV